MNSFSRVMVGKQVDDMLLRLCPCGLRRRNVAMLLRGYACSRACDSRGLNEKRRLPKAQRFCHPIRQRPPPLQIDHEACEGFAAAKSWSTTTLFVPLAMSRAPSNCSASR